MTLKRTLTALVTIIVDEAGRNAEFRDRIEAAQRAQVAIPVVADRDVADFVAQDQVEDRGAGHISGRLKLGTDRRRSVEAACLQYHRDDRQPRGDIMPRLGGRLPQPVMRRQRAVITAEQPQMPVEQREMHRLVGGNREEVTHETLSHRPAEAPRHIEREIDRDEFDMRQRVP